MLNPSATKLERTLTSDKQVACCRLSPDRKFLFAAGFNGDLFRWNLADNKQETFPAHRGWVESMILHPDGSQLFTADSWGQIHCWPVAGGAMKPIWSVANTHPQWMRRLTISPDGKMLATCGNDRMIRLFSAIDGKPIRELPGHNSHVQSVAFDRESKSLASGDLHGIVKHWDIANGKCLRDLDASKLYKKFHQYDQGGVRVMTFDSKFETLYCAGFEGVNANQAHGKPTVIAFDWSTGKQRVTMTPKADFKGPITDVAYHPAGYLIGAGSSEGGGVLWFWKPGEVEETHLVKHRFSFRGIGLHGDGTTLVAATFGDDGGQRGGNGRRLNAKGEYPDFQGSVVLYTLGESAQPNAKK
ncbi:MAG: hypothetical protein K8T89_00405 [Planctomycetes bacterium]|nr:hypothetical protein [Planctomycetota bacterium]